jgi:predicted ArsR family transcriptional regulator
MLEPTLRRVVLSLALAVSMAPMVGATLSPDDLVDALGDQAGGIHPWAGWAVDRVPQVQGAGGSGSGGSSSGSDSGSDGSGGSYSSDPDSPVSAGRPTVVLVLTTADQTLDSLDPLGLVGEQVEPVREAAEGLPTLLLPTADAQASEPAPATASVEAPASESQVPFIVAGTAAAAAAAVTLFWLAGSSGSIGAGAAGSAGKLAGTDLRRLLPFASPLFTRFEKDTVLGHPKREALYALILQDPGVSLQSLCDSTGLSRTAVTHHLRLMELQHLIVSKRMGRSRHYYENGGRFGRDQKDAYAVLQNDRSKAVADFVKQNPGAIQKAVCASLGIQASVAHWHLKRLQEAQLVEAVRHGRTVSYFAGTGLKGLPAAPMAPQPEPAPVTLSAAPMPFSV